FACQRSRLARGEIHMAVARLATNRRGWFRRGCSLPILLSNTRSTRSAFPEVSGLFLVTIIVRARHRSMFGQLHISVRLFTAHLYTQFGMVSSNASSLWQVWHNVLPIFANISNLDERIEFH